MHGARAADWVTEVDVRYGTIGKGVYKIQGDRPVEVEKGQYLRAVNLKLAGEPPVLTVTEYTELRTGPLAS